MRKVVVIIIAILIIFSVNSSSFAETVSGRGYECASYTFYAEATGDNATIYFKQTEATAIHRPFWEDEWGCYHIYYTYNGNGKTYTAEWNNVKWEANNETFSLELPYRGAYTIQIVAYSAEEINNLYAIDHFVMWYDSISGGAGPEWWVDYCYNCWVSNSPMQTPTPSPTRAPTATPYRDPTQHNTTGRPTPTPAPTRAPTPIPSSYNSPYSWDTKFKPGVSEKNSDAYNKLNRLYDQNSGTTFSYVLWNSDKKNGLPDFTAYFNNNSVRGIKVRDGDGSNYWNYMRINTFYVIVNTSNGSYQEIEMQIPDEDRGNNYFSLDFSRSYSSVTSIEIYITDRNVGSGENSNVVHIRDIDFY